jgi:hypothetical protein
MTLLSAILICLSLLPRLDTLTLDHGTYIGEMPAGEGKMYHNERGLYIGTFNRTVLNGRGVHFKPDGSKYAGNFVKGAYQGYGRLYMATGAVICGEFHGGKANGLDTLYYPDGKVFIGVMQNNGATSQGKTYKSEKAARVTKPAFPDVCLTEDDIAFLNKMRDGDYDTPAVFKNGVSFFQSYISPNFVYSEKMSQKSAVVHYEFTVGEDGRISDVTITSSTDEDFPKELIRVIKRSPKWTPATKDGKPVPYTVRNQRALFNLSD